jgi:hypothetical protein
LANHEQKLEKVVRLIHLEQFRDILPSTITTARVNTRLAIGLYVTQIKTGNQTTVKKIIVQKDV